MVDTLRMPLTVVPGQGLAAVEQDGPEDVAQSVALLLQTQPGERRAVPGYGLPNPLGTGVDVDLLAAVVEDWEDRATPALVQQVLDGAVETTQVSPAPAPDETEA